MKRLLSALAILLAVSNSAYAQNSNYNGNNPQDPINLNDNSFPSSNQPNSPPQEPDNEYNNRHGLYKQPSYVPPPPEDSNDQQK